MGGSDEARLALTRVRVNRRPGDLYVYDDRLVLATGSAERVVPMGELERMATRRSWRGARLLIVLSGGEQLEVRGLDASATSVAHRTIVDIARRFHG